MKKKLLVKKLPVFSKEGVYLGRLQAVELDETNGFVLFYQVVSGWWKFKKFLLIHPRQIIKITTKKIVVEDTAIEISEKNEAERVSQPAIS
ncbi:PRC-barrel domain-containing protein [Patescibacteria group bacterium]|nr:PRC-barrel domain-containing protein [Patescibacteria group bacterium]